MNKRKQWYLINYDIADSRRLQCFHRLYKKARLCTPILGIYWLL